MNPQPPKKKDERAEDKGLACPRCGCKHLLVHESRPSHNGRRRRRECRNCHRMVTTIERLKDGGSIHKRPA